MGWALGTPRYKNTDGYAELDGICEKDSFLFRFMNYSHLFTILVRPIFFNHVKHYEEDVTLYLAIIRSIKKHTETNNSKLVIAFMNSASTNEHKATLALNFLSSIMVKETDLVKRSTIEASVSKILEIC